MTSSLAERLRQAVKTNNASLAIGLAEEAAAELDRAEAIVAAARERVDGLRAYNDGHIDLREIDRRINAADDALLALIPAAALKG